LCDIVKCYKEWEMQKLYGKSLLGDWLSVSLLLVLGIVVGSQVLVLQYKNVYSTMLYFSLYGYHFTQLNSQVGYAG